MAVHTTRVSMEVIVTIVSKLVYFTYFTGQNQPVHIMVVEPTYMGVSCIPFTKYHGHPNLLYQKSFS